jgi:hypothetical protein
MHGEATSAAKRLRELQPDALEPTVDFSDENVEKIYVAEVFGLLHVEFYGAPFGEFFLRFLAMLGEPEVATSLRSLTFRGPDEGANGTRNWDFTSLLVGAATFPNLTTLFIEPTAPEHHNQTIIAVDYEEEGQLARLLTKTPALRSLTAPSAPDDQFFAREPHPLSHIRIAAGYDHQGFIRNLGESPCFPMLRTLDFEDFNQRYEDDYLASCTPFEDYVRLITSSTFAGVQLLSLRNSPLSSEQLQTLRGLRRDLTLRAIQSHGVYIR